MSPEVAARLENFHIKWHSRATGYYLFVRDECAAFAHEQSDGISLGSSGLMTLGGFAYLVWHEGRPFLAAHGDNRIAATPEQVEAVRRFSEDLKAALGS